MRVRVYVLCLLKFLDDQIVFKGNEIRLIEEEIKQSLKANSFLLGDREKDEEQGFHVYSLNCETVKNSLRTIWSADLTSVDLESVELGYYHHRAIVSFIINMSGEFSKLRSIRGALKEYSDKIIEDNIQNKINQLVNDNRVRAIGRNDFFYTYPLIILENAPKQNWSFKIPFTVQTTSMCFEILEPGLFKLRNSHYIARISIPGMIVSARGRIGNDLQRDLINVIYQYCLYEKKLLDGEKDSEGNINRENTLNEKLLVNLWEHILENMGGRTSDNYILRLTRAAYIVAFIALILSLLPLLT